MLFSLALISFIAICTATSSGEGADLCDAHSELFGCKTPYPLAQGLPDHLDCDDKSQIMHWATAPEHNPSTYKLFVGTDEARPLTQYTPGQLHEVTILVLKHRMVYRGLLLYAEDSAGNQVGTWELAQDDPQLFSTAHCNGAVMHASAEHKPYQVTLHWRAPADAVGAIRFECLIKYGDANTGHFYWPNDDVLTLSPGAKPAAPAVEWRRGKLGQSCDEVCAEVTKQCQAASLTDLKSKNDLRSIIGPHHVCKFPYVRGCGAVGGTSSEDNLCYYHDPAVCTQTGKTAEPVTCAAKSTSPYDGYRFCPCSTCSNCTPVPPTPVPSTPAPPVPQTPRPNAPPNADATTAAGNGNAGATTAAGNGNGNAGATTAAGAGGKLYDSCSTDVLYNCRCANDADCGPYAQCKIVDGGNVCVVQIQTGTDVEDCVSGATNCPCTSAGGCLSADDECKAGRLCLATECALGSLGCGCNDQLCLTGLDCVSLGADMAPLCVKPLNTDPMITSASAISVTLSTFFVTIYAAL